MTKSSPAFDSALRLLTRREHGAEELCVKLVQKGYSDLDAHKALTACQDLGLQSDLRFVESYTRSRIRQGYGPLKIIQELKARGIEKELIHKVLSHEDDNWVTHAHNVWDKKNKRQVQWSIAELQKQQRFLLYRGFPTDVIAQVVKELKANLIN